MLREKYSVSFRKEINEGIQCHWIFYDKLKFLQPFVSLKVESKSSKSNDSFCEITNQVTKSPFDELELIQLVKDRPVLYDKKNDDFRSNSLRKKAWEEISSQTNWNVEVLQKRWRVMRDRFVRELRRTQNLDANSQVNCSSFFREMLFLACHVRSNKYEVETNLEEEVEMKAASESGDEVTEEWIMQDESTYHESYDTDQYVEESVEQSQTYESPEELQQSQNECVDDEPIYQDVEQEECPSNDVDENIQMSASDVIHDIKSEQNTKKRCAKDVGDNLKNKKQRIDLISSAGTDHVTDDKDEDIAFGNTIGCMLKKIPLHLKTAVKLKLLSSLAEFEAEHKLT